MIKKRNLTLMLRISEEERDLISRASKKMDTTMTELVISAIYLYANIPPAFLAQLKQKAAKVKLPLSTVLINLAQVYMAQDAAISRNFGSKSWERAFRIDPQKGLITDDSLSDLAFREVDKACADLKEKLKTGKRVKITDDEILLIAASL